MFKIDMKYKNIIKFKIEMNKSMKVAHSSLRININIIQR